MSTKVVHVPKNLHSKLKAEAALLQIPLGELVALAVEDYLARTSRIHTIAP